MNAWCKNCGKPFSPPIGFSGAGAVACPHCRNCDTAEPMRKFKADRSRKARDAMTSHIDSEVYRAIEKKLTLDEFSNNVHQRTTNSEDYPRMVGLDQSFVDGYYRARWNQLWREHAAWLMCCDNRLMTSKEIDALTDAELLTEVSKEPDYKSPWARIDGNRSRHVWKDPNGTPLRDKPF
jgi:hypothetical protein